MDADKVLTPFVSVDLVNDCIRMAKSEMNDMRNERLKDRLPRLFEVVSECLNQLEAAAGENKVWWEQWMYDVDEGNLYPDIDLAWHKRNITALNLNTAIKFSIYLLKDAERPWNETDSVTYSASKLIQLCYKVCEWLGIDRVLSPVGDVLVAMQMKALCLYIALHNELDSLNRQATRHNIHFKQPEKQPEETQPEQEQQQPEQPKKPKPMSKEQWAEATLEQKKQDRRGKKVFTLMACKIFNAAVRDGRFIEVTRTGYKWIYYTDGLADDGTSLMYFLYKTYGQRKGIAWDALQALFGVTANLRQFLSNLKNAKDADGNKRETWLTHDNPPEWGRPIKQFIDPFFRTAE